jgi:hypothetical protein
MRSRREPAADGDDNAGLTYEPASSAYFLRNALLRAKKAASYGGTMVSTIDASNAS